jgi:hypothetical protein
LLYDHAAAAAAASDYSFLFFALLFCTAGARLLIPSVRLLVWPLAHYITAADFSLLLW